MENWTKTHPWRFIQTNLREIDMVDIDAHRYVDELKKFKATIAMINVGGIIASYKTDLPFHFQSTFLKGDSLETIIDACHAEGIKVMARNDFSKIRRRLYEANPDWAYLSEAGEIVDYNGDVHACVNGEYQRVHARSIVKEILLKLDVDGLFFNMGGYQVNDYSYNQYGICHCRNCKRLFGEMFGLDLPDVEDFDNTVYQKYRVFQEKTLAQYEKEMIEVIRETKPGVAVNHSDLYRQESSTELGRPLPHWQYTGSSNTRWVRSTYPDAVSSNTTVDFIGFYNRHVAVNPAQQELRLWQNLANTGGLDYYLIGRLDNHRDKSGYEGIKRVFHYHAKNEKYYQDLRSRSDILLVKEKGWGGDSEDRGWVRLLTEQHFLFDEILLEGLETANLKRYKAIILAHTRFISDTTGRLLDDYAKDGGTIVSTGRTGLHDDQYAPRQKNVLKSLGISSQVTERSDMKSAMLLMEDNSHFPTFAKWETEVLYFGHRFLFCEYEESAVPYLKLIPPHNYGPPERCYFEQVSDRPGFSVNAYGKGRGVHIPWYPGALFHREGYVNTSAFIGDLLKDVLQLEPVDTNLNPMVEITLCDGDGFSLVQFVNTSGHFGTTFYEPVPVADAWASIPWDKAPQGCVSLLDGRDVPHSHQNGKLKIVPGNIGFFEAVKIN